MGVGVFVSDPSYGERITVLWDGKRLFHLVLLCSHHASHNGLCVLVQAMLTYDRYAPPAT